MPNVIGTLNNDTLIGGAATDFLKGDAGNDLLDGKGGADLMMGDAGDDLYVVNSGGDQVFENAGAGHDTVRALVEYTLTNNVEDLLLIGTSSIRGTGNTLDNRITGNVGNNVLNGLQGNDTLDGGSGNDLLVGGAGNDRLIGGAGQDAALYDDAMQLYRFGLVDGRLSVADISSFEIDSGNDTLEGIEQILFRSVQVQVGPIHTEFRVNASTAGSQTDPAVAALADGGFVLTWTSNHQGDNDVYAQRYNAAGTAVGGQLRVNTSGTDQQKESAVTALANGGFVVTWASEHVDASGYDIYAQRYDAIGNRVGGEFRINSFSSSRQEAPTIAALNDGGFVVAWTSLDQDGSDAGIYAQRCDVDGNAVGEEFQVNSFTSDNQEAPSITALSDGGFVVTWSSSDQDGGDAGLYAQRYDADGAAVGAEFRINSFGSGAQHDPTIAALGDGGFVVAWTSDNQDGSGPGIYTQVYDTAANAVGEEFRVNSQIEARQDTPSVAALADGGFVIAWRSFVTENAVSSFEIHAQRYDAVGAAVGTEFRVNSTTADSQSAPTIAALRDGGFVVSWESVGQDGSSFGIYAQRYNADGTVASLEGDGSDNTLSFTGGSARLAGGLGNDIYHIDDSGDQIVEDLSAGSDTVNTSVSYTLSSNLEAMFLTGTDDIDGTGNDRNNQIFGNAGNNVLDGGTGEDQLAGGSGDDTYIVDEISERVQEGEGRGTDTVIASTTFTLPEHVENLQIVGALSIGGFGNALNNVMTGSVGNNQFHGGAGNDTLDGGWGNDTLEGGADNDRLIGGEGLDTAGYQRFTGGDISAGYRFGFGLLDRNVNIIDVDTANGNDGSDTLEGIERIDMGGSLFNITVSGPADDPEVLIEGDGNDNTLSFIRGSAELAGGLGNDTYIVSDIGDEVTEGLNGGTDTVQSIVSYSLSANVEHLTLIGADHVNGTGNELNNTITGNRGRNLLDGGRGNDRMVGGADNDIYVVDAAGDVVVEAAGGGIDRVHAVMNYTLGVEVENLSLLGIADFRGTGNALNNEIRGNGAENLLSGAAGSDTLEGREGDDHLIGGEGDDHLIGGDGEDTASYAGVMADYRIGLVDGRLNVVDVAGPNVSEGRDVLEEIEVLSFRDGSIRVGTVQVGGEQEFQVNTFTDNFQFDSDMAVLADGGFIVTWTSGAQDGSDRGVYAQRYDENGSAQGAEFRVNSATEGFQEQSAVVALADGGFAVAWTTASQDGSASNIFAQRYNAEGVAQHVEFRVNSFTANQQLDPAIAALSDGGFLVSWTSLGQDGSDRGVYAQRYDENGSAQGAEFRVNSFTTGAQRQPDIAALEDGGFVVVWDSFNQDGSFNGIYGQYYGADGFSEGGEFRVNTFTNQAQANPHVAALADGGYVVSWDSAHQDGSSSGVYAQRYDANGLRQGAEFRVNSFTANDQGANAITALADGGFVIAWHSLTQDTGTAGSGVYAQRYAADGSTVGGEFQVNTTTFHSQSNPSVMAFADGGFVVSWTDGSEDGSDAGIFAQRYNAAGEPVASGAGPGGGLLFEGSAANDTLSFTGGSAQFEGGLGNDTYFVDDIGDVVVEGLNAGTDTVDAAISFTLPDNVEHLTLRHGSININGTGNALNNTITGNFGDNILHGGLGNDRLIGDNGDDYYIVNGGDTVVETSTIGTIGGIDTVEAPFNFTLGANVENLILTGNAATGMGNGLDNKITGNTLANSLNGGGGNDTLNGGLGNDTLNGGVGADRFVFDRALAANVDRILDFNAAADTIVLENAVFTRILQSGPLSQFLFVTGAAAQDVNDFIVYNSGNGKLFYDADANGAGAAVHFATLSPGTVLSAADFVIV